jgi:hypothetical protein
MSKKTRPSLERRTYSYRPNKLDSQQELYKHDSKSLDSH